MMNFEVKILKTFGMKKIKDMWNFANQLPPS